MRNAALDKLIWSLIYGGLLLLSLGSFVRRAAVGFGTLLQAIGGTLAAIGAVLILVRASRPPD
ncbi:conserved hypothetical protein [Rubrivivax sp. A210]|uniref:hypothetical protein n=1 Tax=Rubrivivax sp. A210 TaxID=2772301 RepID=UPI001918388E|nr:hypothetical protein [Rubrivivax sp. A210]CAD5374800.1 conserved hypothetical protein [Rubrivivax sp. A210]